MSKAKKGDMNARALKESSMTPGPNAYTLSDRATKPARFENIGLGVGHKVTAVPVKLTPGPGDYDRNDSAVVKKSHNMMLNTFGGIQRELGSTYRQNLIE